MKPIKVYTNPQLAYMVKNETNIKMAKARKGFGGSYAPGTLVRLNGKTVYRVGVHGEWLRGEGRKA